MVDAMAGPADAPSGSCSARPVWVCAPRCREPPPRRDGCKRSARWLARLTVKSGKVKLELPPIVENGNTVPLTVTVDSPMSEADHVTAIHIFNEKNPQPYVAAFESRAARRQGGVSTRIRLANSQQVVAIAGSATAASGPTAPMSS